MSFFELLRFPSDSLEIQFNYIFLLSILYAVFLISYNSGILKKSNTVG